MNQSDLKILLTRWGSWSSSGGGTVVLGAGSIIRGSSTNLGYKSMWDVICRLGGGGSSSYEVDSEMLAVDNAMLWLKEHSGFDYRLLKLKYRYCYSYNRIADKLTKELPQYRKTGVKMCDKYAKKLVDMAEETLLKYLENKY